MNEGIACCPENRTSTREAVVDAMLASGDELAQLQPALNLLSPPLNATPGEALLASCYEAGADHNAEEATRAVSALRRRSCALRRPRCSAAVCCAWRPGRSAPGNFH